MLKGIKIYILAAYPTDDKLRDGMFQRVRVIDSLVSSRERCYINIGLKNPIFKVVRRSEDVAEIMLNPIFPFFIISHFLLRAKVLYAHSIHLFKYIPYWSWFLSKSCNVILDAHGVVPEEFEMYGMTAKSRYMNQIEAHLFRRLNHCICVSRAMIEHFRVKFSKCNPHYHLLNTSKLLEVPEPDNIKAVSGELQLQAQDCVVIYSGNTQKWQNVGLVMESIKKIEQQNVKFIILSGDPKGIKQAMKKHGIPNGRIVVRSVAPNQLSTYYSLSHYGYVLRDDIVVNRVANPTKMLEYLQFGIVPVVLTPYIGDYHDLGYENIAVTEFGKQQLAPIKSKKNVIISEEILRMSELFQIERVIDTKF